MATGKALLPGTLTSVVENDSAPLEKLTESPNSVGPRAPMAWRLLISLSYSCQASAALAVALQATLSSSAAQALQVLLDMMFFPCVFPTRKLRPERGQRPARRRCRHHAGAGLLTRVARQRQRPRSVPIRPGTSP